MGFNPAATNGAGTLTYAPLYKHCIRQGIPITSHCQMGSYDPGGKAGKALRANTTPRNWVKVLEADGMNDLRLNLAHFGGETALADSLAGVELGVATNPASTYEGGDAVPDVRECWPLHIMGLLLKHPNVFADISAFDFTDRKVCKALIQFVEWDRAGRLAGRLRNVGVDCGANGHRLTDKLLWGSDVPMVLAAKS